MSVHITKTYNIGGLIGLRQNAVKNAGETLGFKEMSLFKFPDAYDSDDELHVRMDGIIASLCPEDIVIFQHPSGESPRYDGFLFEHLRRYPNVKMSVLDSLFEKCDFYLDINHEGEIVDAVHRAFLNNMLIVGYEETMHNAYYTADTNTFKESEYADMAEALNLTLAMPHLIDEALAMQKKAAVAADATDYMEILHL